MSANTPNDPDLPGSAAAPDSEEWSALQHEVARYVASMTGEMANMARSAKLDLLVYFLDMAQVEAAAQSERTDR
ncbi:MAG: hypothetical protein ACRCWO_13255 [Bosea sp. (in: a-proteobacteria)]